MLHWLLQRGHIDRADYEVLQEGWLFLYHLRNRVALLFETQPDLLPTGERLATLARSLDFSSGEELAQRFQQLTESISRLIHPIERGKVSQSLESGQGGRR
jgi:glutamine synthetase adenylyltransferase